MLQRKSWLFLNDEAQIRHQEEGVISAKPSRMQMENGKRDFQSEGIAEPNLYSQERILFISTSIKHPGGAGIQCVEGGSGQQGTWGQVKRSLEYYAKEFDLCSAGAEIPEKF